MPRRIKEIQVDNLTFKVGAFTIKEAEDLINKKRPADGGDSYDADVVSTALNFALDQGEPVWTLDRIYSEMDRYTLQTLRKEILEMNGLKLTPVQPAGEPQAAGSSASSPSSAAA